MPDRHTVRPFFPPRECGEFLAASPRPMNHRVRRSTRKSTVHGFSHWRFPLGGPTPQGLAVASRWGGRIQGQWAPPARRRRFARGWLFAAGSLHPACDEVRTTAPGLRRLVFTRWLRPAVQKGQVCGNQGAELLAGSSRRAAGAGVPPTCAWIPSAERFRDQTTVCPARAYVGKRVK